EVDPTTSMMQLQLDYDTSVIFTDLARAIGGYYSNVLQAMATEPESHYDSADLLSPTERDQILLEWNHTGKEFALAEKTLVHLLERTADEHRAKIALVFEDSQLSYKQMDRRSNQFAHYLMRHGVAPEVRVGVFLERSLEMM